MANLVPLRVDKDWNQMSIFFLKRKIRIDVDLLEIDPERAQRLRHLLAEVAAAAPVQLNLCQSSPRS